MMDVINADIDPHRWFAGLMMKLPWHTTDLSRANDKEWVAWLMNRLKKEVPSSYRQNAKFANFGLPGGLQDDSFYKYCRAGGGNLTFEEAKEIRGMWMSTFTEINEHLEPESATPKLAKARIGEQFEDKDQSSDGEDSESQFGNYIGRTWTGMKRANCSKTSACNFAFQGLVAQGAKIAGFELIKAGFQCNLHNFVHDEYNYSLPGNMLAEGIGMVEKLMVQGMKVVIPDVKVKVETSVMFHWDKGAVEYASCPKDENGFPIIEEPDLVKRVYGLDKS